VAATERTLTRVPVIKRVHCDDEHIYVDLADGRVLGVPLAWSERLSKATPKQRANYQIEEFGDAIHWPDVDEDIGLATFLGISEDALHDALDFHGPTRSTQAYLALARELHRIAEHVHQNLSQPHCRFRFFPSSVMAHTPRLRSSLGSAGAATGECFSDRGDEFIDADIQRNRGRKPDGADPVVGDLVVPLVLVLADIGKVEQDAKLDGRNMIMVLGPK
jgi:hypothetical protein